MEGLNVNVIEAVLGELLPMENKDRVAEPYYELLADLEHFGVTTPSALGSLVSTHKRALLLAEAREFRRYVNVEVLEDSEPGERLADRLARGVYFIHVGFARQALSEQFGAEAVRDWLLSKNKGV